MKRFVHASMTAFAMTGCVGTFDDGDSDEEYDEEVVQVFPKK